MKSKYDGITCNDLHAGRETDLFTNNNQLCNFLTFVNSPLQLSSQVSDLIFTEFQFTFKTLNMGRIILVHSLETGVYKLMKQPPPLLNGEGNQDIDRKSLDKISSLIHSVLGVGIK